MATLYEIDRSIEDILDRMFSEVDEETGEVSEDVLEELEQMQIARVEKLGNIGAYIKNLESDVAAIKAERDNLKKRMDAKQRKAERLRDYVSTSLLANGETKMETARVKFSFRSSERVEIRDEEKIPKQYLKETISYSPDKESIKKALKAGEEVAGCEIVQNQNLQIK